MENLDVWTKYEKDEKTNIVGTGNYGIVYKVKDKITGMYYALKEIQKSKFQISEKILSEEIELVKKRNTENNLSIKEIFNQQDYLYIITDLCEYNLEQYINRKNRTIPINEIKFVLTQLNNVFKIMVKENDFIDIKPNNILISLDRLDKCLIKLNDYGSNKFIQLLETASGTVDENLMIIAPEVLSGEEKNSKSDLWSLGTIIYYMLFKEYPYIGRNEYQIRNEINTNRILRQCDNGKLNDLLNKMLKVDVKERISWEDYFNHPFFTQDSFEFNCDKHLKIINNYCNDCKKNICEDCLIDHSNHQIIPFNKIGLSENEINRIENIFKDIDNKLNSFNKIRKDIEYLFSKMKLINENKLIYENNMDYNYKEYYINYLENINKILENNELKLIGLMPNEIVCVYDIKKELCDKDDYLNNPIRILNCYEEAKREGWYLKEVENNEKEIKENCELYLNDNKIDFCYKYKFPQEGKYTIKIRFKKPLTNTNCMFIGCNKLSSIDLSNFNTSNVNNMSNMFYNCFSLTSLNLSNFTNNNVKNMSKMFYNCSSLNSLNLSNFINTNIINMSYMFNNCSSLNSLNLTNFTTSDVINMWNIFYGMKSGCEIISNDEKIKKEINFFV